MYKRHFVLSEIRNPTQKSASKSDVGACDRDPIMCMVLLLFFIVFYCRKAFLSEKGCSDCLSRANPSTCAKVTLFLKILKML